MSDGIEMKKVLRFTFGGFAGKDFWRNLTTPRMQTKHVAKRLLATMWKEADPQGETPLVVQMPHGNFRILDDRGNTEPYHGPLTPIG